MVRSDRIENTLHDALASIRHPAAPPRLLAALDAAVFPGGARIRPLLALAAASACGAAPSVLVDAFAAAVELVHCASLVHDDLPCFDNADMRRGQPTVHRGFGEPVAVLVGDQLIVLGFEVLARAGAASPDRIGPLVATLARGIGVPHGLIAGQGWESEDAVLDQVYRRAKTGALFEAAAVGGALAAGMSPGAADGWRPLGQLVGDAYQIADDIADLSATSVDLGKPVGKDAALGRPNAAERLGLNEAARLLERLLDEAQLAIPPCPSPDAVRFWLQQMRNRLRECIPDALTPVRASAGGRAGVATH